MKNSERRDAPAATTTGGVNTVGLSESDLTDALATGRIHARYQPIARIADWRPVGLEVLARLEHPVLGTVSPELFVPRMEAAGLGGQLTRVIVGRAFADWREHDLARLGLWISLNFPLDVLVQPEALDLLDAQREAAGIKASSVVVELTESRPVMHAQPLRVAIARLRDRGYGVAIDDVGPAERDPRVLMDMRFTTLKLDKELVRASADRAPSQDFLNRAIAGARAANLTIIAEGVETADIWARMQGLGVDQAQGFLVARPLTVEAVAGWHAAWCAAHGL